MSIVRCEDCEALVDSDYVEVFRAELNERAVCESCWLNKYEECHDCEKIFPIEEMARMIDPWGGDHGLTGRCVKCEDEYDPTPYAYDSEPPVTDEERYRMAAEQKRRLR